MTIERIVKNISFVALFTLNGVGLREFTDVFAEMDSNRNGVHSTEEVRDYVFGLFGALQGQMQKESRAIP